MSKEVQLNIVEYLKNKSTPIRTVDLAKAVGVYTSSQIHSTLTFMEKQNHIVSVSKQNEQEAWTINMLNSDFTAFEGDMDTSTQAVPMETDSEPAAYVSFGMIENLESEEIGHNQGHSSQYMENSSDSDKQTKKCLSVSKMDILHDEISCSDYKQCPPLEENKYDKYLTGQRIEIKDELNKMGSSSTDQNVDTSVLTTVKREDDVRSDIPGKSQMKDEVESSQSVTPHIPIVNDLDQSETTVMSRSGDGDNVYSDQSFAKAQSQLCSSTPLPCAYSEPNHTITDKVLKVMLASPMCSVAPFILQKKTGLNANELAGALAELKSNKFIAEQKPIWVLTPLGEQYVKSRPDFTVVAIKTDHPELPQRQKKVIQFGPPPLPHQILANTSGPVSDCDTSKNQEDTWCDDSTSAIDNNKGVQTGISSGLSRPPPRPPPNPTREPSLKPLMSLDVGTQRRQPLSGLPGVRDRSPLMNLLKTVTMQSQRKEEGFGDHDPVFPSQTTSSWGFERHSRSFDKPEKASSSNVAKLSIAQRLQQLASDNNSASQFKHPSSSNTLHSNSYGNTTSQGRESSSHILSSHAGVLCPDRSSATESWPEAQHSDRTIQVNKDIRSNQNISKVSASEPAGQSSFKPPLPPLSLIQQKLTLTEISPSHEQSWSTSQSKPSMTLTTSYSTCRPGSQSQSWIGNSIARPQPSNDIQVKHSLSGHVGFGQDQSSQGSQIIPAQSINMTSLAGMGPASISINTESFAALNKNAVSALMEYAQSRHTDARMEVISQRGPSHKPK